MTVAAMLLHSILGCSLHHACACEAHEHGEQQPVQEVGACGHDHGGHHHDHACDDANQAAGDDEIVSEAWVSIGCDCCEKAPCEGGDSPCCSEVQCSFILTSDVEFSPDFGPALLVLVDDDPSFIDAIRTRRIFDVGRLHSGVDGSPSRCALHCSWQI